MKKYRQHLKEQLNDEGWGTTLGENSLMNNKSFRQKKVYHCFVFYLPVFLICIFIVLKIFIKPIYISLVLEDGLLETFQCIFYAATLFYAVIICKRFFSLHKLIPGLLYLFFAIAILFILLEEVSWGQRILKFQTPAYMVEHNTQNEFSIHNLKGPQSLIHQIYIAIGLLGAFSGLLLKKLVPQKSDFVVRYILPDKVLFFYFFPGAVVYLYLEYLNKYIAHWTGIDSFRVGGFFFWRDQETAEFLLALGFLFFASIVNYRLKDPPNTQSDIIAKSEDLGI